MYGDKVKSFQEYQIEQQKLAIYPRNDWVAKFAYVSLGLIGEAGEVSEKIKKGIRKNKFDYIEENKDQIAKELGDVLWYISALSSELGYDLEEIANINILKLKDRESRNKIDGEGDNR
jgi:NTP pyrophosphatase (non-canonical NTP hydrolase)|tara:strand:- start:21757 stop:22110 length:354 start_codon:yes stop_codon:yes gene_type:complete